MHDQNGVAAPPDPTMEPPPPPPPPPPGTQRRPRVREVSSRFMSPLIQSNSTPNPNPKTNSDFPRSKPVQRRLKTDENHSPDTNKKLDGSTTPSISSTVVGKQPHHHRVRGSEQKNNHSTEIRTFPSRPDTPIADRIVPSRYRQVNSVYRSNSLNSSVSSSIGSISSTCIGGVSAAKKLLQEVSDVGKKLSRVSTSSRDDTDLCSNSKCTSLDKGNLSCPNSPLCIPSAKSRNMVDAKSSMPDADRWLEERNNERISGRGDCARSLNFSAKIDGGLALPPHPSSWVRAGLDSKKGKKVSNHQEDVHRLKMLMNCYMQWHFATAKSEALIIAQKLDAERKCYALGTKISYMRDVVERKQHELAALKRLSTISAIVEAQLPYLEEWSTLKDDYCTSLSDTTNSLLNLSIRVPLSGAVRADPVGLKEALTSAVEVIELIGSHIQPYLNKAQEMDVSLSQLGRVATAEKCLIEECGDVLSSAYLSQLQECSLQCTLIQFDQQKINEATS